jgi:hypothetical protein
VAKHGPPLKITDEMIETIAAVLSQGHTREFAAKYARISYQTFYTWNLRGKKEAERIEKGIYLPKPLVKKEAPYLKFFNQIEEAEADAVAGWQETLSKAAKVDPQWAFKMLQLREPKGYRPQEVTYTVDITEKMSRATDEQLQRIRDGEDPLIVLADTSTGGTDVAPAPGPAGQQDIRPLSE